jgi:hypothetical protein
LFGCSCCAPGDNNDKKTFFFAFSRQKWNVGPLTVDGGKPPAPSNDPKGRQIFTFWCREEKNKCDPSLMTVGCYGDTTSRQQSGDRLSGSNVVQKTLCVQQSSAQSRLGTTTLRGSGPRVLWGVGMTSMTSKDYLVEPNASTLNGLVQIGPSMVPWSLSRRTFPFFRPPPHTTVP